MEIASFWLFRNRAIPKFCLTPLQKPGFVDEGVDVVDVAEVVFNTCFLDCRIREMNGD
jgi:hypothetical protein